VTRLAVLSDIHGNLPALEAVLADMHQFTVDGAIFAGDYTGGPHPMETIRLLRSLGGWMIRGNGDTGLVRYERGDAPSPWYTHHQFAIMRWAYDRLDEETRAFLASLPEQRLVTIDGTAAIRVVHGSPRSQTEGLLPDREPAAVELALSQLHEPVLVCGHTHTPWAYRWDGKLALNPGAVCGPLDGYLGAQYALLTWDGDRWAVGHRAVPYDVERLRVSFEESGLLGEGGALARALLLCLVTGQNVWREFLTYARGLAARAGSEDSSEDGGVVPDDVWERAEATFDWDGGRKCAF
jgi:putative phosphoesterase